MTDTTRCPHGRTEASRRDNPCPAGFPSCAAPKPDLVAWLGMIEHYAIAARTSIHDEHEGNTRYYVNQLAGLAASVAKTLESM